MKNSAFAGAELNYRRHTDFRDRIRMLYRLCFRLFRGRGFFYVRTAANGIVKPNIGFYFYISLSDVTTKSHVEGQWLEAKPRAEIDDFRFKIYPFSQPHGNVARGPYFYS